MARKKGIKNSIPLHKWSDEEKEYLKTIVYGRSYKEIQELMNNKFEYQFTIGQINGAIGRYGLNTGRTGYFPAGNEPWNKGTKGLTKANKTSFKKGNIPKNKKPIGSERVNVDGYTEIKVSEPNRYRLKHRVIYEQYHDVKLKPNEAIIFLDGNKQNLNIDNLEKVTRSQLLQLNQNHLIKDDAELTKAGVNIAKIITKCIELNRGERK